MIGRREIILFAGVVVLICLQGSPSVPLARTGCKRDPRDYGELTYCYLAQFHCLPDYFGIDGKPDYEKALSCFENHKLWDFAALMYVNGEGAPRDPSKVESSLRAWKQQVPDEFDSHRAEVLRKASRSCAENSQKCRKLSYCGELAESTQEMEICEGVGQFAAEKALTDELAKARNQLKPPERALFDRTVTDFKAYQLDDMQRLYLESINTSFRDLYGAWQAGFVRDNFLELIKQTIQLRKLKSVSPRAYKRLAAQLSRAYNSNIDGRRLEGLLARYGGQGPQRSLPGRDQ